jgi:hypothetical protein
MRCSSVLPQASSHVAEHTFYSQRPVHRQLIGDIVLIDVADVLHSLATRTLTDDAFDMVEPLIGIEASARGLLSKSAKACWTTVVRRKREEGLVNWIQCSLREMAVDDDSKVLDASVDIRFELMDVTDVHLPTA